MSSIRRWALTHVELDVTVHWVLFQFQLERFPFRDSFALIGVLACKPGMKRLVFAIEQFQDFADDVGRVGIKELCVPVQIDSDFFLQANLEQCGFWLLGWCLQECQVFYLLSSFVMSYSLYYKLRAPDLGAGKTRSLQLSWAGTTPRVTLATEWAKKWGRSSPVCVLPAPKFFVAHSATSMLFNSLVHPAGEPNGERRGDLCLSCTCHRAQQILTAKNQVY